MKKIFLAFIISVLSIICCFGQISANAQLQGRTVLGTLPKPSSYSIHVEGHVVVQIKVNQYGEVTDAIPGVEGTTVTDKNLWSAARNAALKAHFNQKADAPAVQQGTITYIFKPSYRIKDLVDTLSDGHFVGSMGEYHCVITGQYLGTIKNSNISFLIEHEDDIIPVKLIEKTISVYEQMQLHKGDTLTVQGKFVCNEGRYGIGLIDAIILESSSVKCTIRQTSEVFH